MEYLKLKLLNETVRFLELCQKNLFEGKIDIDQYLRLTETKYGFIDNILDIEKKLIFIDKDFTRRLNELFKNDRKVYSLDKKAIGNEFSYPKCLNNSLA